MRKIMMAGLVAGMTFAVGCQRDKAEDVRSEREELIEQRQELAETRVEEQQRLGEDISGMRQEHQEEIAERRQGAEEEIASEREDVAEQREDLAEARQERQEALFEERQEGEAMGGAGEAGEMHLRGTVESKKADKLTLKTEQGNRDLILTTDTELVHMGRDIRVEDIPQGAEIRASYSIEANRWIADRVEVLNPAGKQKK